MFFWVFPRRQIVVGRRFGTLYQFHLQRLGVECEVWEEARYFILYPYRVLTIWRRGNTEKNIFNIQIKAKVWNQV